MAIQPPPPFPTTETPLAKTFITCDISDVPIGENSREAIVIGKDDDLPAFAAGRTITINGRHDVRDDLVLAAEHDLIINGSLDVPLLHVGQFSPGITLISRHGRVVIAGGASVGGGMAGGGLAVAISAENAIATAHAGLNGGPIKIVARTVEIAGTVTGIQGGPGGAATATGVAVNVNGRLRGGFAKATGGSGGHGGDIRICAETVFVRATGRIFGSYAGVGASAKATASNGRDAEADGGNGADPTNVGAIPRAGNIIFSGTPGTACAVTVDAGGEVKAGALSPLASEGGDATATGGQGEKTGTTTGGRAFAVAGVGSTGGSVIFVHATLTNNGAVDPGCGGIGGFAHAYGGNGETTRFLGYNGGRADAFGGQGGLPGHVTLLHKDGKPGPGQQADIRTGRGGDATDATSRGGHSGLGTAEGGPNGANRPGETKTLSRQPPNGQDGADGQTATAQGASTP